MQTLRWMRVIGDTVFAGGVLALVVFVTGLSAGWSIQRGRGWSAETGGSPRSGHAPVGAE